VTLTLEQALDNIYTSLSQDNLDIDQHIAALRGVMAEKGLKSVEVEPQRLVQNNRAGRKMMESYFKKRGVIVTFKAS